MSDDSDGLRILAPPGVKKRFDDIEAAVNRAAGRRVDRRDALGVAGLALLAAGGLAGVAQAFREHRLRVHDARIATFGERVEDFFLISDEQNRALTEEMCAALRSSLLLRLEAPAKTREQHASA